MYLDDSVEQILTAVYLKDILPRPLQLPDEFSAGIHYLGQARPLQARGVNCV